MFYSNLWICLDFRSEKVILGKILIWEIVLNLLFNFRLIDCAHFTVFYFLYFHPLVQYLIFSFTKLTWFIINLSLYFSSEIYVYLYMILLKSVYKYIQGGGKLLNEREIKRKRYINSSDLLIIFLIFIWLKLYYFLTNFIPFHYTN